LTGACVIALGVHASGILGNDEQLLTELQEAGARSGERLWQLPLWNDYDKQIESIHADMQNVGGRPAGTITAAAFLKKFIRKDTPWAHLDIAGTAWVTDARPYINKGATGVGVKLLIEFLRNRIKK
ncbi:MAG: aminopeptidase, partial [Patescibacteria group bacterium]|nr:aminopeptidase [Patescibacteria group bacterium]